MEPQRKKEGGNEADGMNSDERKEKNTKMQDDEQKRETLRSQTSYYCKTCSGEPSLCPVPCFEIYHTRLIYRTVPDLETRGEPSEEPNRSTYTLRA